VGVGVAGPSQSPTNGDQAVVNLSITQGMLSTYLQFLQVQTQTGKMKLEYLRRKEEREEKESTQRRELERMKIEREVAEFEHNKQKANVQQKADRALVCILLAVA
jgi:histone acetyltransferase MYST4